MILMTFASAVSKKHLHICLQTPIKKLTHIMMYFNWRKP
ncbi:hypothetical protein LLB_2253 [Legionella longbeachae D-4968]|nr:hypothetical protein LLB_2253 [Legionella longbeachae D-4968]